MNYKSKHGSILPGVLVVLVLAIILLVASVIRKVQADSQQREVDYIAKKQAIEQAQKPQYKWQIIYTPYRYGDVVWQTNDKPVRDSVWIIFKDASGKDVWLTGNVRIDEL